MFVIPTWRSKKQTPTAYRKQIRKVSEVIGVTCKVRTIITFLDTYVPIETERIVNGVPMIHFDYQYKPGERYGFETEVDLSKVEYKNHKNNIEEYVCKKVKEQDEYQNAINSCISLYADNRDYTVDTFVPQDDLKAIEVKWTHNEYEEYVPV